MYLSVMDGYSEKPRRADRESGRDDAYGRAAKLPGLRAASNGTVALICSLGGHLEQMKRLEPVYRGYDRFLIIPREESSTFVKKDDERVYTIADVNEGRGIRNPAMLLLAMWETFVIFLRERPRVVLSTGAGVAIPGMALARLFGARAVYIESFARIKRPSRAGRLCYYLADQFYVQHEELLEFYPKARYAGALYAHL